MNWTSTWRIWAQWSSELLSKEGWKASTYRNTTSKDYGSTFNTVADFSGNSSITNQYTGNLHFCSHSTKQNFKGLPNCHSYLCNKSLSRNMWIASRISCNVNQFRWGIHHTSLKNIRLLNYRAIGVHIASTPIYCVSLIARIVGTHQVSSRLLSESIPAQNWSRWCIQCRKPTSINCRPLRICLVSVVSLFCNFKNHSHRIFDLPRLNTSSHCMLVTAHRHFSNKHEHLPYGK